MEAENKALKKKSETSGGKSGASRKVPAPFSVSKDEHVTRIKNRFSSLMDNAEFKQILEKYSGFYQLCVNCGNTDMKTIPCGCGKKGSESSDPKIRDMHAAYTRFRELQVGARKGAK